MLYHTEDFPTPDKITPHDPHHNSRITLHELMVAREETAVCIAGFDDAICGLMFDGEKDRVVYCYASMLCSLVRDGMTIQEATEYLEFNTVPSLPDQGPIIIDQHIPVTIKIIPDEANE